MTKKEARAININKDTAILVVSFGTSHHDTREKTIDAIEGACQKQFPNTKVARAFTSGMIINIIKKRDGIHIDNVEEAMKSLIAVGYKKILVQPTHILHGEEYDKLVSDAKKFQGELDELIICRPLLSRSKDYEELCLGIADYLIKYVEEQQDTGKGSEDTEQEKTAVVLMGHGTEHFVDTAYAGLEYRFHALGYKNVFVGTVEGYPDFETMLKKIKAYKPKKCILFPLMIVAGEHAKNDMAGEEDSWKVFLRNEGFDTECILEGLGEIPAVREIYVSHLIEGARKLIGEERE